MAPPGGSPSPAGYAHNAHTSVLLGQVVSHLPVVIAVEDAVGDADVIGCHLMNALGDADDGGWGQGIGAGEAALGPHGAGGRRVGRHGGWASSAPGRREVEKPEWRGWEQARWEIPWGSASCHAWLTVFGESELTCHWTPTETGLGQLSMNSTGR